MGIIGSYGFIHPEDKVMRSSSLQQENVECLRCIVWLEQGGALGFKGSKGFGV